jgi:hypothetical protein
MEPIGSNQFHSLPGTSMSQINPVTNPGGTPVPRSTPDRARAPENSDGAQLSKLGSVLNGLENGAARMRSHVQHAIAAVRSGTYRVDALQLSRLIVGEAMDPA